MLAKLANLLAKDALTIAGLADISSVTVLPLATGMALTSVLLSLKRLRPPGARYVVWPRYIRNYPLLTRLDSTPVLLSCGLTDIHSL